MSRTIKKKLVNISVQHEPFFGRGRKEIGEKRERERETGRCGNEGRVSREQNSWTVSKQKKVLASAFEAQQQSLSPFSRDEDHKSNLPPAKSKRFDRFMNQVAAATEEESVSLPRLSSIRQATCYVIFWGFHFHLPLIWDGVLQIGLRQPEKKRDWNVKRVGRFAKRRRWRFAVLISFTHTQTRPGL